MRPFSNCPLHSSSKRKPKPLREKIVSSNSENSGPVMQKIAHGV